MTNPKSRSGPVAGRFYPTTPGEPIRRALNDMERKEASIQTHAMWMSDPPGTKNCHFLDITADTVGPHGINVKPEKIFDSDSEWQYLEGMLTDKVSTEIAEQVRMAHQKLPKLFHQIKTDSRLYLSKLHIGIRTYSFRW